MNGTKFMTKWLHVRLTYYETVSRRLIHEATLRVQNGGGGEKREREKLISGEKF